MWYHDHAMMKTAPHIWRGLAGFYLLGDEAEAALNLPGGDYDAMLRSLATKVLPLSDATVVLPGHGPATTIGRERATNPYLAQAASAPKGREL